MSDPLAQRAGTVLELTLLIRRDCPLCEEFHSAFLHWNARARPHRLRVLDVDSEPALAARFGARIPVLIHEGEELCAVHFCGDKLNAHAAAD